MITTNIVFDWKNRVEGNGIGPVDLRVTVNRKSFYISTGVRVRRSEFKRGVIVGHSDSVQLNALLEAYRQKAIEAATDMIEEGALLESQEIRRRVNRAIEGEKVSGTNMFDWMSEQVASLNLRAGTIKHYVTLIERLRQFGLLMCWADLSTENICKFDSWLHRLKCPLSDADRKAGERPRNISDGGVYTYHKCLKALLNRAVLFDKIDRNPYDRLRGKFRRGDKERVEFLTEAEMKSIESLHPVKGSSMAAARDLFVFQMHTGLSYADTQAFNIKEYSRDTDGHLVSIGRRVKTGVQFMVRLSDECERILEMYGWKLPKLNNSDYNYCLKALGAAVGIEKPLHSHIARHSFATSMTAHGVHIQNVAKMLGHANIAQTQRYAKVLPESVFADFRKIEETKKLKEQ